MSDDIDDFIEKMKKFFNFNSDIVDMDFFLFPTDNPDMEMDPEEIKSKGFKVSYHYDSKMDKPEIKIEGDMDKKNIKDIMKNFNIDKIPQFNKLGFSSKNNELDASELSLEPTNHTHGLHVLEPFAERNDFDNFSEIVLEMPGMNRDDIFLHLNKSGKKLTITAHNSERRYYKSIDLPFKSSNDHIDVDVNNGVVILKVMKQE